MTLELHRAHGLLWQAAPLVRAGRLVEAERLVRLALHLFRDHGDRGGEAQARLDIANVERVTGRELDALVNLDAARALVPDDPRICMAAALGLGWASVDLAELDAAAGHVAEAEALIGDVPERNAELSLLRAALHHHAGRLDLAAGFASHARAAAARAGDDLWVVGARVRAGLVALDADDEAGSHALDDAVEAAEAIDAPAVRAGAEAALAAGLLAVGDPVDAALHADLARHLAGAAGDPRLVARAWVLIAVASVRRGLFEAATRAVDAARPMADGHPVRTAEVRLAEGHLFRVRGRKSAHRALDATADLATRAAGVRRLARWLRALLSA